MRALGLFTPEPVGPSGHLAARWIWLRALGVIFFSAFFSLAFQVRGLIGPHGILPAQELLDWYRAHQPALLRFWQVPTLLWFSAGRGALVVLVAVGMAASVALALNLAPRLALAAASLTFLSFVAAARDFSGYQSDGMLLEAGVLSMFLAPPGWRPRLGSAHPPMRAARLLLLWEWFRIYFCSGIVKLSSQDPEWRSLTALDHYYQNGPLPTWVGYYVAQLPHGFHAACALFVLSLELGLVLAVFVPVRRVRLGLFLVCTALQTVIILTANYAFLNYFVLALGILLVDDQALSRAAPAPPPEPPEPLEPPPSRRTRRLQVAAAAALCWLFYATLLELPHAPADELPELLTWPASVLAPFRIANGYGLFAVMTEPRYEIEFQGTRDGVAWIAYPFRRKPQDLSERPGIYAPYQPRFDWNLWFASLASWQENRWVLRVEQKLLEREPDVLALFRRDPFADGEPPIMVRAMRYEYRFTDLATLRATGRYWNRLDEAPYAPALARDAEGHITVAGQ